MDTTKLIPEPIALVRATLDEAAREFARLKREECTTTAKVFQKISNDGDGEQRVIWDRVCEDCEHRGEQCHEYELETKCKQSITLLEDLYGLERTI